MLRASTLIGGSNSSESIRAVSDLNVFSGAQAAKMCVASYLDPFSAPSEARIPDTFTMTPTAVDHEYGSTALAIANGTSGTDGSLALYFRGEPYCTTNTPSAIAANHAITWATLNSTNYLGTVPTTALSRTVGAAVRFTYLSVGDPHDVIFNVMEIPPADLVAVTFTNFPTYTNIGPTVTQREVFAGRQFILRSGETVQLTALPMDVQSCKFMTHTATRGTSGLTGFIAWVYGLKSTDTVAFECKMRYEFVVPSVATAPTAVYETAIVKPDTVAFDKAMSTVTDASMSGANVVKAPAGTLDEAYHQLEMELGTIREGSTLSAAVSNGLSWLAKNPLAPFGWLNYAGKYLFGSGWGKHKFGGSPTLTFYAEAAKQVPHTSVNLHPPVEEEKEDFLLIKRTPRAVPPTPR